MNKIPVKIVFESFDALHFLVDRDDNELICDLIHEPQDTGDMFTFEYAGRKFKVNPQFSGFIGVVYL